MRHKRRVIGAVFAGVLSIGLVDLALAQAQAQKPADIVKARKDNLKAMGGAMKAIVDQVKSGTPDKEIVGAAAKKVAAYAKELPQWFPAGSGPESGVETDAKPEIWTRPADFAAAAAKLPPEADKLVEAAATGDAAQIGPQLKATGAACGGCHKVFRTEKN